MITIRTVSNRALRAPLTDGEYVGKMAEIQVDAAAARDMGRKTAAFWKMENLSSEFLKRRREGQSLRDPRLAIEVRPIAHCGMGIAAVEVADFDPARICQVIDSFSDPEYRLFAYEGSGAMLSMYEADLFGLMTRGFGLLRVLPVALLRRPEPARFVASFDPEIRRLIAHGYGRMLYFKSHSIAGALQTAAETRFVESFAAAQGVAFAYAMVNNGDLDRVFRAGERLAGRPLGSAFRDGLIYALEFWEWMSPGFLESRVPATAYESALFLAAGDEIAACRRMGPLAPFRVGLAESRAAAS